MKNFKKHKTTPAVKTISLFFLVLVPFLLIWLLIGEIDLLDVDWIVGIDGTLWQGTVTNANYDWLRLKYDVTGSELFVIGESITISATHNYFNPFILIYLAVAWVLAFLYPIVLKFIFKTINYDILPFSVGLACGFVCFIVSALIPSWKDGLSILRWLIRLLILFSAILIFFFVTNVLVNLYLVRTPDAQMIFLEMKNENCEAKKIKADLRKELQRIRKDDLDYADVETKKKQKKE